MFYSIQDNNILINDLKDFNAKHILECGQMFRATKTITGYKIISKDLFCSLIYEKSHVIMISNNADYFVNYFDLNRDYGAIKTALLAYPDMAQAVQFGSGIRILNQDWTETIISFIISANNNIGRIKLTIERLCQALGKDMGGYHAFPTIDALASVDTDFYKSIGAGYRASYLSRTAKLLQSGFNLDIRGMSTACARKHLMQLTGVGNKVADCILLFAYHRTDAFPTDVWIARVHDNIFGASNLTAIQKADRLSTHFGKLSGYAQQYLFYHARENKIKM